MLKKFKLRNKELPVPVPLQTLGESVDWVEKSLLNQDAVITGVVLDGIDRTSKIGTQDVRAIELSCESDLHIKIDNPKDLSLQTIEIVGDLAFAMSGRLRRAGIETWSDQHTTPTKLIEELFKDCALIIELIDHLNGILDYSHTLLAPINGIYHLFVSAHEKAIRNYSRKEWKDLSSNLVTRLDPLLRNLSRECELLQLVMLTDESSRSLFKSL